MRYLVNLCILSMVTVAVFNGCSRRVRPESAVDNPVEHFKAGMQHLGKNELDKAATEFDRAVKLDRSSPLGYQGLALVEMQRGSYRKAMRSVNRAISRSDSAVAGSHVIKGRIFTQRGKRGWLGDAREQFAEARELEPDIEEADFYEAEAFFKARMYAEARDKYQAVISKGGSLKGRAAERLRMVNLVLDSDPRTKYGREIALMEKINRATLCVLLVEELDIVHLLERHNLTEYEDRYDDDGDPDLDDIHVPSDAENHDDARWIRKILPLDLQGLTLFADGRFYPERDISRAQTAVIVQDVISLVRSDPVLESLYIGTDSDIPDVRSDYYAYNAIMLCLNEGIMEPVDGSGRFDPDGTVGGAEAIVILRALADYLR